ncbi:hypothetical protein BJY01DRAFT_94043 [Aspergillus pseudoustus]|uniref:Serine/threonine-protein kinase ppk6 n=1 Tax=Aspergillus pseudoustus TaxID=1810923 RepID=A0ABR4IZN4_9EURO
MSADLFAEFGYGPSTSQPSRSPTSQQHAISSSAGSLIPDFDTVDHPSTSTYLSSQNGPTLLYTQPRTADDQLTRLDNNDFGDFERPGPDNSNDVLFDATLESFSDNGSDDWGEFETAEARPSQPQTKVPLEKRKAKNMPSREPQALPNLLDSFDSFSIDERPQPGSRFPTDTLILDDLAIGSGASERQRSRPTLSMEEEPFEEWGDFTDGPLEASQPSSLQLSTQQPTKVVRKLEDGETQAAKPLAATQSTPASHVRPTNIPPPSILLELFPQLFERLRQEGTEAKRKAQQGENLYAVAISILCTLKAAARVVTGRSLRWKRDAILSQSMRIGPARSGKAGGMKLSTVNKNEDIKEQQEAVDVINMWRERATFFNSVIQAAGKRPVQVIVESTRVTTATAGQGAIKAAHACALCGLKRDERIPKLDENVEDSFGEWWTEHWGHTDCRHFWEDNIGLLSQR